MPRCAHHAAPMRRLRHVFRPSLQHATALSGQNIVLDRSRSGFLDPGVGANPPLAEDVEELVGRCNVIVASDYVLLQSGDAAIFR